jgi:hypothetical protein
MAEEDYSNPCVVDEITCRKINQFEVPASINHKFLVTVTNVIFATEDKLNSIKIKNKVVGKVKEFVVGMISGDDILSAIKVVKDKKVADIAFVCLSPNMKFGSVKKTLDQINRLWKIEIDRRLLLQNYIFLDVNKKDMRVFSRAEVLEMEQEDLSNMLIMGQIPE